MFQKCSFLFREMLMKLVMTMSKDEIFIRSKNIMNEQKKKNGKTWGGVFGGGGGKKKGDGLTTAAPAKSSKSVNGKRKISKNEIGNHYYCEIK